MKKRLILTIFIFSLFLLFNGFCEKQLVLGAINPYYDSQQNATNQQKYTYPLHEKIPGQEGVTGEGIEGVDTLQEYLDALYKFGIAIVAILAVVMIGVGAFMYIVTSAGNAGKLADAKGIITNALIGLVMALLAWLILFIINPDLVNTSLNPPQTNTKLDAYVNDGRPDPEICGENQRGWKEVSRCDGNKICLDGSCIYKNSVCNISENSIPGVCDKSDFAQPGEVCGPLMMQGEFLGRCTGEGEFNCPANQVEVTQGKQCLNSICCQGGQ